MKLSHIGQALSWFMLGFLTASFMIVIFLYYHTAAVANRDPFLYAIPGLCFVVWIILLVVIIFED